MIKLKTSLLSLTLAALLMTGLLAACGDEATPVPASNTNTTAASGGGNTGTTTGGNAGAVIKESASALSQIKDYQASLDITFTGQGAGNLGLDVLLKGSPVGDDNGGASSVPEFKGTVTKSTFPSLAVGSVAVLGSNAFIYDPATKVVLQGGTGGNSEIYNLFTGSQTKSATLFSADLATPTLVGDEKVGSYNASKLTFVPKSGLEGTAAFGKNVKATIWIDKDTKLPVQMEYSEEGATMKWLATNLQVNKGIDAAKMGFTPPADAKVVDITKFGKLEKAASLDEAKTKAGFAFPTVSYLPGDLPKTPTGVEVQTTPLGNIIDVQYSVKSSVAATTPFPNAKGKGDAQNNKSIGIKALKSSVNLPNNLPTGATVSDVTINGQKGTLASLNETEAVLIFAKDGVFYTISSNGYSKAEVQKVGEGIK